MEAPDDEFEPLFDYSGAHQTVIQLDESGSEDEAITVPHELWSSSAKRRKTSNCMPQDSNHESPTKPSANGNSQPADIENDDNWLPSPPKQTKFQSQAICTDATILLLRQKKAELQRMTVKVAEESDALTRSEELNADQQVKLSESQHFENGGLEKVKKKRDKIVLMVQDESGGCRPFRIYTDDHFEKLYHAYGQAIGKNSQDFVFRFDGEQISSSSTPKDLGLEAEDILEVYHRAS